MIKILFVVNPISGGKDKASIIKLIKRYFDQTNYLYSILVPKSIDEVVSQVRYSNSDIVVAVGGDGTVNLVAQGVLGTDKVLGIVPCGSGNGLAYHLGLSRRIRRAIKLIKEGGVETIDYGLINGIPFFCTSGVGLDAKVAEEFALHKKRGLNNYVKVAFRIIRHIKPVQYSITVDKDTIIVPALAVTVGNANQWGNHAKITPLASVQDGLLDLMVIMPCKAYDIPGLAAKIMDGRLYASHHAIMFRGSSITIKRPQGGLVHYDGEPVFMGPVLNYESVPSSLRVIVSCGEDI